MEKKDLLEEKLEEVFHKLAKDEEDLIQDEDIHMSESLIEELYDEIQGKIYEVETENIYAQLSEEDLKALELGRKIMEEEVRAEREAKAVRKKKRIRMYICLAAALIMTMALGVTSIGGAERIIQMLTQTIGDREVKKINSDEDNLIIMEENEEEAYQRIYEKFGVRPVKIMQRPEKMKFRRMAIDDVLQMAEMFYDFGDDNVIYFINASYTDASLGIDIEDEVVDTSKETVRGCEIEIKEYNIAETEKNKFSANFNYNGLEYMIIGTMEKEEFGNIINNLFFVK